jgi:hypothetical protein
MQIVRKVGFLFPIIVTAVGLSASVAYSEDEAPVKESAKGKDGVLLDAGLGYSIPAYPGNPSREGGLAFSLDASGTAKIVGGLRVGGGLHVIRDGYEATLVTTAGDIVPGQIAIYTMLIGPTVRYSLNDDGQGLFVRGDVGYALNRAALEADGVQSKDIPGESGFGFMGRVGFAFNLDGKLISPQLSYALHSLSSGSTSSIEFGVGFAL